MKRTSEELQLLMDRFQEAIRRAGVKLTPQRIEIYREAARTGDHPDIETITRNVRRKMPTVSLDTVYRTLDLFKELGLVWTLRPFPARVRFDANMKPHHHFICTRCGKVRDFYDRSLKNLKIPESAHSLGRVESARVELRGLCADCLKKKSGNGTTGT